MSCFVAQVDLSIAPKLKEGLIAQGFSLTTPPYTVFQGKKSGVSVTLYASGKLTVQGSAGQEFIRYYLEPEILETFSFGYEAALADPTPRIGVDESGKGDFFGPLCIAGVFGGEGQIQKLLEIGVKDSKQIGDKAVHKLAEKIKRDFTHHVVQINPLKYNELYEKFGNLNLLLGWGHATVIEQLIEKTGCERVIIDQFAAEHVVERALKRKGTHALLTQRTKAESDPVVAAASILARAAFLDGLAFLGTKLELTLPKGAGAQVIEAGKRACQMHGKEVLPRIAKLHFKTTDLILS